MTPDTHAQPESPENPDKSADSQLIKLRGVRQNNLRGIDVDLPVGKLIAITGVSGSGKSSLAFDTLYAEGQRRYVECLSSYARQFMQRMPKPHADSIVGILPTVALQQGKRLRASRSTVATLTEVLDYLKVVFAALAVPQCPGCGKPMARLTAAQIAAALIERSDGAKAVIGFALRVPGASAIDAARRGLQGAGYHRVWRGGEVVELTDLAEDDWLDDTLCVIADRLKIDAQDPARLHGSIEQAMRRGDGAVDIWLQGEPLQNPGFLASEPDGGALAHYRATSALRCLDCDRDLPDPAPALFSYNSPLGACEHCNGFGRMMAIDWNRCIPNPDFTLRGTRNSLKNKAIRPWATQKTGSERRDLYAFCEALGIDTDTPWRDLPEQHKTWIIHGHKGAGIPRYYSLARWFGWLEKRSYRMHVRVQLARYRSYETCTACDGTRLRPEALAWRLAEWSLPQWLAAPLDAVKERLAGLDATAQMAAALRQPWAELSRRIGLLHELGLGYLALDRGGRTLAGGELQRVQLVTALASGLSQVLYVLDEPSVGLHARDSARLLGILQRLRAAGNTVVMVEHDPGLIGAADHVIDIGPGPGERGGLVVYQGPPAGIDRAKDSVTARFLTGHGAQDSAATVAKNDSLSDEDGAQVTSMSPREISLKARKINRYRDVAPIGENPWLVLCDVTERNLSAPRVRLRRGRLNVICGVSGSGKSTLVEHVLYRQLLRKLGEPTDPPGACGDIIGADGIREVVLVEQAPIGGSSRANCATYLKAWDTLRRRLASEDLANERGYTASTFSFNTRGGRCEACEGAGVEIVDMQFLSDVRIPCEACGGQRFSRDVLEVRHRGRNVGELLAMTAAEVAQEFADDRKTAAPFVAMCDLGVGYLRLGQSLATLSGGESQRLKIAHHLLCAGTRNSLLLLDEPSTGLHLADVAVLIQNLRALVWAGNTVVVVEHHLDVINAADHLVELGPEGGPGGGKVVFTGDPNAMASRGQTVTADYLRAHRANNTTSLTAPTRVRLDGEDGADTGVIRLRGARVHNLQGIDLDLPRDGMTVVTGLSGSGKSSLAFDVVFAEGQRRFLDCLSPYARQYLPPIARPDIDSLQGLPPTVAIAQRTTRGGVRSTVATLTDIYPYLRLLYARCGTQRCPKCGELVTARSSDDIAASIRARFAGAPLYLMVPAVRGRKGQHRDIIARNRELGRLFIHIDGRLLPTEAVPELRRYTAHDIDEVIVRLVNSGDAIDADGGWRESVLQEAVETALLQGDGTLVVREAESAPVVFARDRYCGDCDISVEAPDPVLFSFNSKRGWCPECTGSGIEPQSEDADATPAQLAKAARAAKAAKTARGRRRKRKKATKSASEQAGEDFEKSARQGESEEQRLAEACPVCHGSRLRPAARAITIGDRQTGAMSIDTLAAMPPGRLGDTLVGIKWRSREATIAGGIVAEVVQRCRFLSELGLGYLGLGRGAVTLSGGESQRIRLAAQLSSNMRGVVYVLDEPSIGLHAADNARLLRALGTLSARGNGLLVVEHDEETIRRADRVIELGPGGGEGGGTIISDGTLAELLADPNSPTGRMLSDPTLRRARDKPRSSQGAGRIELKKADRNNLQDVDVRLLRGRFNGVCGVSGSGKSTLVRDLLVTEGRRLLLEPTAELLGVDAIKGLAGIERIAEIDQRPIGRTPRSCPATYLKVMDPIRTFFATLPDARASGLTAGAFSFNVAGGRCETCKGAGVRKLEMSFLPAGYVLCEQCHGGRFDARTLLARYKGATIADVLRMSIEGAAQHFVGISKIHAPLAMATRVGLGYLRLGQGSNTLSGGEAQRIKIVAELARRRWTETLYVLDEPTTGLHLADQRRLMQVLHDLVDRGDTVVVIEHNLDLLKEADWLVDLGPGGGDEGGSVCWQGTVAGYVKSKLQTPTAVALRR